MKIPRILLIPIIVLISRTSPAQHDDHGVESSAVTFKEGGGLIISEHTAKAIGVQTEEAAERSVHSEIELIGQVFDAGGQKALASAQAAPRVCEELKRGDALRLHASAREDAAFTGRVARVDEALATASGLAEVIIEFAQTEPPLAMGDFVHAAPTRSGGRAPVVAVPKSALLVTAFGDFVYVQNGGALLRVPVKTGNADAEWIEISDGLFAGDIVAVQPVEWLYLTELRLTKGGGHCH